MAKLITVRLEANPENIKGSAWIGYWDGKPTKKEVIRTLKDELDIKNTKQELENCGYWYLHEPIKNLANPNIHRDNVWVVPICQYV